MASFLIFLMLISSILIIFRLFIKFYTQNSTVLNGKNLQLPPGSKGWPFVGEMLSYFYQIYKGVPENFVEERRKKYSTKVFKTSLLGQSMAILCGAEGNKFLFSNEKKLVQVWFPAFIQQIFPKSNKESNVDESTRLRGMISPFLKIDSLRKRVGAMDSVMKQHLKSHWSSTDKVQVSSMAKKYTSGLSCQLFLSIYDAKIVDEFSELTEVIDTGLHAMPVNLPGTALNRAIKKSKIIRKEIEKLVKQRRIDISEKSSSTVPDDVITHMLTNTDENGQFLNEFEIPILLLGMLEGAYANQYNTITLVMMHLSELPDVYDNVLREQMEIAESKESNNLLSWEDLGRMKYTWNVVCEVLRLFPPLGTFREAISDFEYNGYLIPKGYKMHLIPRATQSCAEYFPDPNKFDPTRFEVNGPIPYTYAPFGGGPRMCPGVQYARLSILVFIHNVVTKFKWERLIPDEKLIHGAYSSPAHGLPIHFHPLKS